MRESGEINVQKQDTVVARLKRMKVFGVAARLRDEVQDSAGKLSPNFEVHRSVTS